MQLVAAFTIALCMQTVAPAVRRPRLTVAEQMPSYYSTSNDGAYSFGYDLFDPATGNTQFRTEERYANGTIAGSYGYVDALGRARSYKYVADEMGYRVISEKTAEVENSSTNLQLESTTTESTITWTRPSKRKLQEKNRNNVVQIRKYNSFQPPGYYRIY